MENQKRVVAVHDISCVGKCSLTVALPILSAAGIETSVIPTAVLSTHTGGFAGYTFRDLTDEIEPITAHWKSLDLRVDSIYTGYLGSERQLSLVGELISDFKKDGTFVMIDPVMGDNGKLYSLFDHKFALGMRDLCKKADMVVPNITEACEMLEEEYIAEGYSKEYIEKLLKKLTSLGPRYAVLSGVSFETGRTGAAAYDSVKNEYHCYFNDVIEGYYHGTGDIFASALLCAFLSGKNLTDCLMVAAEFTAGAIRRTHDAKTDPKYGVDFEHEIPKLIEYLK